MSVLTANIVDGVFLLYPTRFINHLFHVHRVLSTCLILMHLFLCRNQYLFSKVLIVVDIYRNKNIMSVRIDNLLYDDNR